MLDEEGPEALKKRRPEDDSTPGALAGPSPPAAPPQPPVARSGPEPLPAGPAPAHPTLVVAAPGPPPHPARPPPGVAMPHPGSDSPSSLELFAEAQKKANAAVLASGTRPTVDKYFGSKLPPVCRQLGCYVTDDGKFFYCINPNCHKDRKRETKFNRRKKAVVYFFCPKCKSREIQLHLKTSLYECLDCAYSWKH